MEPMSVRETKVEGGFTLLEVMVAVFLFGMAMCGLAQMGYASMLGNRTSAMMTTATALAQEKLEQTKLVKFDSLKTDSVRERYGEIIGYDLHSRTTVTTVDTANGTANVLVTVYWDNDKHKFKLRTMLSDQ